MAELERVLGAYPGDRTQDLVLPHPSGDWMNRATVTAVVAGVAVSLKAGVPMPGVSSAEIETARPLRHAAVDGAGPGAGLGVQLPEDAPGDSGDKATFSAEYDLNESTGLDRHGANSHSARQSRGEIGELIDFDPHDPGEHPALSGIYVLYDISERPLYVGQGKAIDKRIRDHNDKFWFRSPIVESASYVQIDDKELRERVEAVLIKFLKSNAVINKRLVDR